MSEGDGGHFGVVVALLLDFLESKSMTAAHKALQIEYDAMRLESEAQGRRAPSSRSATATSTATSPESKLQALLEKNNLFTSELEVALARVVGEAASAPASPPSHLHLPSVPPTPTHDDRDADADPTGNNNVLNTSEAVGAHPALPSYSFYPCPERTIMANHKRGCGPGRERAVFYEGLPMPDEMYQALSQIDLPIIFHPHRNELEEVVESSGSFAGSPVSLAPGTTIANRYKISGKRIGRGTFSRCFKCLDLHSGDRAKFVCLKVVQRDKDCTDAAISEVRTMARLFKLDPEGKMPLTRLRDFFYYREHIFIVTELWGGTLRQVVDSGLTTHGMAWTIAALAEQLLTALAFLHENGITHADVKPENVCVASMSDRVFKLIDMGSAVTDYDGRNSYVESRWYRAPEVILGLRWGHEIDIWSSGCVLAELVTGFPVFTLVDTRTAEGVLASQVALLGPMPEAMRRKSPHPEMLMTPKGEPYLVDPPGQPPGAYSIRASKSLADHLHDLSRDADLTDFVMQMMEMHSGLRPTALSLLKDQWLRSTVAQWRRERA